MYNLLTRKIEYFSRLAKITGYFSLLARLIEYFNLLATIVDFFNLFAFLIEFQKNLIDPGRFTTLIIIKLNNQINQMLR